MARLSKTKYLRMTPAVVHEIGHSREDMHNLSVIVCTDMITVQDSIPAIGAFGMLPVYCQAFVDRFALIGSILTS